MSIDFFRLQRHRNPDFATGELLAYNIRMLPIILETTSATGLKNFVEEFIQEHDLRIYNCFEYEPELKELSIKQIRDISLEATFHSAQKRLFHLMKFDSASTEAQNAFLKTLEEHQSNLYFILSVNRASSLLPTILSRCRIIKLSQPKVSELNPNLQRLIEAVINGNLSAIVQISNLLGKTEALFFFDSLISLYRARLITDKNAGTVLKIIIKQQNLIKYNHVDAQTAIDSTLIAIYKSYNH